MKILVSLLFLSLLFSTSQTFAGTISVSGQVTWTDAAGATHPARFIKVQIWDKERILSDRVLATVTTNERGNYSATVNSDDGTDGTIDLFVRVFSQSLVFKLSSGFFDTNKQWQLHKMESAVINDVTDGKAYTENFKATGNFNGAISIVQAKYEGNGFASKNKFIKNKI